MTTFVIILCKQKLVTTPFPLPSSFPCPDHHYDARPPSALPAHISPTARETPTLTPHRHHSHRIGSYVGQAVRKSPGRVESAVMSATPSEKRVQLWSVSS